jgi:DNA-binding response OmpR family regulator
VDARETAASLAAPCWGFGSIGMHALIVEDDDIIATMVEAILRRNGYTSFDFAASADSAISAASVRSPDLITSDVRLSPGSGVDAVEKICSDTPVPVIFITATPGDIADRMPQYQVLRKPFGPDALEAALTNL